MSIVKCTECGSRLPAIRIPSNVRQAIWGGWTCRNCREEFDRFGARMNPRGSAAASAPGRLAVSPEKLRLLRPDLFGFSGFCHRLRVRSGLAWDELGSIEAHLLQGDSRAAVVVSVDPLLVAAYSDEIDAVAILEFPVEFVEDYGLRVGTKLLTVNSYVRHHEPQPDLDPGPLSTGNWNGFSPLIADFVSDDTASIAALKRGIDAEEWRRAFRMGKTAIDQWPDVARDGRPIFSGVAARRTPDD